MMKIDISFERLPLWQGVQEEPGVRRSFPFHLGWDPRGFISQTTEKHILEQVIQTYAEEDYTHGTKPPGASEWANRLGDEKFEFVVQNCGSLQGKSILEIGAGSLYVANKLTDKHEINQYLIIDPAIQETVSKKNIKILRQYFDKDMSFDTTIDLVIGFSVLEHVPDPIRFLLDLHSKLHPVSGTAILSFPDIKRQFRDGDFNAIAHEHTSYLTPATAIRMFNNCGFSVLKHETRSDTLWFFVEANRNQTNIDSFPMDEELLIAALKFHQNITYVSKKINSLSKKGKTIAIHGSSNGLNNLFFLSDLEKYKNIKIFDNDSSKTGKYLPACSIPIKHSSDPNYKTTDIVFVAALSFYEEIKDFLISTHGLPEEQILPLYPQD